MKRINSFFYSILIISALIVNIGAEDIDLNNISQQQTNNKPHKLLFFHMNYCPYCKAMIKESIENKQLMKLINDNFNFIDININTKGIVSFKDFKGSKHNFAKSLKINFYPTTLFLNNKNEIVYKIKGYRDITKFRNIIKFIASNSYLTMSLGDYLNILEMDKDQD